jgi:O-antigen/teichoic acid export membrane protein
VTSRLLLLATPVAAVLFPAFAATYARELERTRTLLGWGMETVFLALFPCTLTLAALAPELLQRWLGPEMALHSASVMRWLAAGVLVNGAAQVALALVQSCGRPDWSAKLHCLELPFYVALLIALVRSHGVTGAAIAWTSRTVVDAAVLTWFADRQLRTPAARAWRRTGWCLAALATLAAAALLPSLPVRIAIAACGSMIAAWLAWRRVGPHLGEVLTLAGARR